MDKGKLKEHYDYLNSMYNRFIDIKFDLSSKSNKKDKLFYQRKLDSIIHTVSRYIKSDFELYHFIASNRLDTKINAPADSFFYDEFFRETYFANSLKDRLDNMKELIQK